MDYQFTGQPVMIGGTMASRAAASSSEIAADSFLSWQGTCSYVLTGTDKGMHETFGRCERRRVARATSDTPLSTHVVVADCSTCHGAGRARSRNNSRNKLEYQVRPPA